MREIFETFSDSSSVLEFISRRDNIAKLNDIYVKMQLHSQRFGSEETRATFKNLAQTLQKLVSYKNTNIYPDAKKEEIISKKK